MRKQPLKPRRLVIAGLVAAVAAAALILVPSALEGTSGNRLSAFVVATNSGPLPACSDASPCTNASQVWDFVHVVNANQPTNLNGGTSRATVANAFVVSSVDETIFVNGVEFGSGTNIPPPNLTDFFVSAGRWPATVTCGQPISVPCNVVKSPAILPGENTVIFYNGWTHASSEPNGTYVFKFVIHGTLNGDPVDLTASSPAIRMTG
jgi:hypothetical protein